MSTKRDILSVTSLAPDETLKIVRRAKLFKSEGSDASLSNKSLANKSVALIFDKPSLRTRTSFQVGIHRLGGFSVYLGEDEVRLGTREPVSDIARVLSGYVDCIIARVSSHQVLEELASYASVPVINALSDWEHPCQTMADLLTMEEHLGGIKNKKMAFIGDGNNVARSLCLALPAMGGTFAIAAPEGYNLDGDTVALARRRADSGTGNVLELTDPVEAVADADTVYTDVWASMGQEGEAAKRREAFKGYQVDPALMSKAKKSAIFMHDMPAHYGEEVPEGMLEHPQSVAYDQAHNRLYAQMALLEFIFSSDRGSTPTHRGA